jgi:hypothetical protein
MQYIQPDISNAYLAIIWFTDACLRFYYILQPSIREREITGAAKKAEPLTGDQIAKKIDGVKSLNILNFTFLIFQPTK